MENQMSYLACPYTHPDKEVMKARVDLVNIAAAVIIKNENRIVFSPLSHSHYIQETGIPEGSHELWLRQGDFFLDVATEMIVLCLKGWDISEGIRHEIHRGIVQGRKKLDIMVPIIQDETNNMMEFIRVELVVPWDVPEWLVSNQNHYTSAIIEAVEVMVLVIQELNFTSDITPEDEITLTQVINMVMAELDKKDPARSDRTRPDNNIQ
jgi:hypothetical protein